MKIKKITSILQQSETVETQNDTIRAQPRLITDPNFILLQHENACLKNAYKHLSDEVDALRKLLGMPLN